MKQNTFLVSGCFSSYTLNEQITVPSDFENELLFIVYIMAISVLEATSSYLTVLSAYNKQIKKNKSTLVIQSFEVVLYFNKSSSKE